MKPIWRTIRYLNGYTFDLYTYEPPYLNKSWIYVVGVYNNQDGTFAVKYVWMADTLANRWMDNHHKKSDFIRNNCNCLGFMEVGLQRDRERIEAELISRLQPTCNDQLT